MQLELNCSVVQRLDEHGGLPVGCVVKAIGVLRPGSAIKTPCRHLPLCNGMAFELFTQATLSAAKLGFRVAKLPMSLEAPPWHLTGTYSCAVDWVLSCSLSLGCLERLFGIIL